MLRVWLSSNARGVGRRRDTLHYMLDVGRALFKPRCGVDHPLIAELDTTFAWTEPDRAKAEAIEHDACVFLYGPSGRGQELTCT